LDIYCDTLSLTNITHIRLSIDAGAPVYLYEYQHPPKFLQQKRPSFVGTDHADEMFTVFGLCFTTTHVKLASKNSLYPCPENAEQSPDGKNLVYWSKYEAEEKYLAIGLKKQVTAQHLKKERFVFLTQTIPEKIKQHEENAERSDLLSHLFCLFYSFKK
ncbi:liver carboxylesterase 1F-like, partial [Simochromis diagramma]|uniref:liver carboxylesterase 1F-like n=1 Tax=Simochromis diagramma TaxID=43689 RepID=UPI001A7F0522